MASRRARERAAGAPPPAGGALRALAVANARFWPTVAPQVRRELARWEQPAREIPDGLLRTLALGKLTEERFNAEVAATLATLAPRASRPEAIRAIVALELLFDYLDGRTERPFGDPIAERERLFEPFIAAVAPPPAGDREHPEVVDHGEHPEDWAYLTSLSRCTRDGMFALPAAGALAGVAEASARRCAQAQTRLHAAPQLGDQQLQDWAREHGAESGLQWREYTAGCASSVLAIHALIAAAAAPGSDEPEAQRIDAAYLAIGAVITILDSVVDHAEDTASGQPGFIRLFEPGELPGRMRALTREALARASEAPHGEHHAMTLAGVVAYYTSHPGARAGHAREVVAVVRRELSPTIWPALAVMRCWRTAKSARAAIGALSEGMQRPASDADGERAA
jgi:tetraprenyl-beta-curcumene synthase